MGKIRGKYKTEEDLKGHLICTKVDKQFLEEIEFYAEKIGLSRSQLMRNLMKSGLDDLKVLHHSGALGLIVKGIDLFTVVREALRSNKYNVKDDELIINIK